MYHTPTAGDWSLYCSVLVYLTFVPRGGSSELVMCMVISLYQQLFICSLYFSSVYMEMHAVIPKHPDVTSNAYQM